MNGLRAYWTKVIMSAKLTNGNNAKPPCKNFTVNTTKEGDEMLNLDERSMTDLILLEREIQWIKNNHPHLRQSLAVLTAHMKTLEQAGSTQMTVYPNLEELEKV